MGLAAFHVDVGDPEVIRPAIMLAYLGRSEASSLVSTE